MRGIGVALIMVMGLVESDAHAEPLLEANAIGPALKLSHRIRKNLNDYSNDVFSGIAALTIGVLDMQVDLHQKRARLHLGGGDPDAFRLRIDSDVLMARGSARVQARIDLGLAGHRLAFDVPQFDMNTASVYGERAVQLSLPLLEGTF